MIDELMKIVCQAEIPQTPVPPSEFLLLPWGEVGIRGGGNFKVDEESAHSVLSTFQQGGTDLVIDFEHQSVPDHNKRPDGKAPAAGWITGFRIEPGVGIIALSSWTDEGKQALSSRQYRYHSPVVIINRKSNRALRVSSVALTNTPAMEGIKPLVAKDIPNGGKDDLQIELSAALGVSADASADELVAAIKAIKADGAEVVALRQKEADRDAEELLALARREGKLLRWQEPWAKRLILADRTLFEEWVKITPIQRPRGRVCVPDSGLDQECGRQQVILMAKREYDQAGGERKIPCSRASFVDVRLEEHGHQKLNKEEIERIL